MGRQDPFDDFGGAQVPALHSVLDDPVVGVGVLDDPAECADHHAIPGRIRIAPRVGADAPGVLTRDAGKPRRVRASQGAKK